MSQWILDIAVPVTLSGDYVYSYLTPATNILDNLTRHISGLHTKADRVRQFPMDSHDRLCISLPRLLSRVRV